MENLAFVIIWFAVVGFIVYANSKAKAKGTFKPQKKDTWEKRELTIAEKQNIGLL